MKLVSPKTLSLIAAGVLSLAGATFAQQGPPPGGSPDQGAGDAPRVGQRADGGGGGNNNPQDDIMQRLRERRRQEGQANDQGNPGQGGPGGQGGPMGGPGGGPGGPGGPGQGGPGRGANLPPEVARFNAFINMVDSYAKLAKDPDAASVAAVVSAADVLRPKGAQGAIDYFTKILPDVKSPTVQRAIRLQLMDFYKTSNQPEKALEQLQLIMTTTDSSAKKE